MRRLYVQIYLTIIASLVLVVVISGAIWQFAGADRFNREAFEVAGKLAAGSLAPQSASKQEQQRAVQKLSENLGLNISLYDADRNLIVSWGTKLPPPDANRLHSGRIHGRGVAGWQILLPDNRWLVTGARKNRTRFILAPLIYLATIVVIVGLCAYPVVRRLTGRLERLQRGVERIGAGDFSTRVAIEGKDEVAQLAASFNQATERIDKLVSAHRQLLANASHELRTPLSRIRLGIDLLKGKNDEQRKKALEQDIDELDQLVDEILLMSRLDAHSKAEPWQEVDLLAIAAEECVHYEDCSLDGKTVIVMGDLRLLQRLVRNLLENAIRHGLPPVEMRILSNRDNAILEVLDHGPGIPESEREKVLAPFYRLPGRQDIEGSGLGLALVAQITRSHKGNIEFFNTVDSAQFGIRILLPLKRDGNFDRKERDR